MVKRGQQTTQTLSPSSPPPRVFIKAGVDAETYNHLSRVARIEGRTISGLVGFIIRRYLKASDPPPPEQG